MSQIWSTYALCPSFSREMSRQTQEMPRQKSGMNKLQWVRDRLFPEAARRAAHDPAGRCSGRPLRSRSREHSCFDARKDAGPASRVRGILR